MSRLLNLLRVVLVMAGGLFVVAAHGQQRGTVELEIIKPVKDCSSLTTISLRDTVGAEVSLAAASVETPKGTFCHVTGIIAPAIHLEVDLPQDHWTQRMLQAGCGGLCGMINASIGNAGTCAPALNGEFVVAATDMGHQGQMGGPGQGDFAADPQKRIDFAYRANHLTALVAKALIKVYYGQPQRYAYFSGCSDGGREALMEAQRFPDDFDGISAGAPALYFQIQNSLNHAWTQAANTRADGTKVLQPAKLELLHTAVIAHCDALDGVKDGLLTDPRACKVDPTWVVCSTTSADKSNCLTPEEWTAAYKLYTGPSDAQGRHFLPGGWQPGSELQWAGGMPGGGLGGGMVASMAPVVFSAPTAADTTIASYPFTVDQFRRALELHDLNDATDTDLRPFAAHGGKLIMYHGWSDTSIAPLMSVAYYSAVQRDLGKANVDHFFRLFMIPGMGHCGGGDGFSQFDTLSPLMAWVEGGNAPAMLIGDKVQSGPGMGGGPDGRGGAQQTAPYARANQPAQTSRPIYPFPEIPKPNGSATSAVADYSPAPSDVTAATAQSWIGSELLTSKTPRTFTVEGGKLIAK